MCLILVGWQAHPDFPLVVAANRDEFFARPTATAHRWMSAPHVMAGRDLEAGGTWLGVTDSGRFAAVTNVREPGKVAGKRSRGDLTRDFLTKDCSPADYAGEIKGEDFAGFNLLLADNHSLHYISNREGLTQSLAPGIYGLSNHRLDTPWPKLVTARQNFVTALERLPDESLLFDLLADDTTVDDENLPKTGVPLAWERLLSAIFVKSPDYGTRASTVLLKDRNGRIRLQERTYGAGANLLQSSLISTSE